MSKLYDKRKLVLSFGIVIIILVASCVVVISIILYNQERNHLFIKTKTENTALHIESLNHNSSLCIQSLAEQASISIKSTNIKYKLGLLGIFRNESHIMKEWIDHYIREGVDHFYLINNNSDDEFESILQPFKDKVDVFYRTQNHAQMEHYKEIFSVIKPHCEWLIVVDFDEFIYSPLGFPSLKETLRNQSPDVGQVFVRWLMFGSSGYIDQPSLVIPSFTKRGIYTKSSVGGKSIVRCQAVDSLNVHTHNLFVGFKTVEANDLEDKGMPYNESTITKSPIRLNHYVIQSWNWFKNVKTLRGDVNGSIWENIRDREYFQRYDHNDLEDLNLAKKTLAPPS